MSNIHDFMQVAREQGRLEPDCVIGEGDTEPYLISIAISLKRIADALYEGSNSEHGILHQLSRIEFNTREAG